MRKFPVLVLLLSTLCAAQTPEKVTIQINYDQPSGPFPAIWNFVGYDEPNYTYAPYGKKLLGELSALSPTPVYIRAHNLLTTGDGSSSMKWGSTNVYTEDAAGKPVYDWTILDRIFDTYHAAGIRPLVEVGFMPEALSAHPEPYRHNFPNGSIFTGWAYPPKDYAKWGELVFQFTRHLRRRYGEAEVKTWLWEIWNEPDIPYWQGTPEEYFKLYDYAVDGILRAFPQATVGGPDSTGPANPKAAEFLRSFLEHCAHGKNYVTGKSGSPLMFISFHPKGQPAWEDNHIRMGLARQLASVQTGFKVVASFPEYRHTPIVLGESDPEGCAACTPKDHPQLNYRNLPLFASYTTEMLNNILWLKQREQVNFLGAVTWSFEFEDQPIFMGFRELATHGIDKPLMGAFHMYGLLGSEQLKVTSSAAVPNEEIVQSGVRARADINAIATKTRNGVEILAWNYHDDDVLTPASPIELTISGLPPAAARALLEHFRVDDDHSNAFTMWKAMGSPQSPTPEQFQQLENAGQLQLLGSPAWVDLKNGRAAVQFTLPREALSLLRLTW